MLNRRRFFYAIKNEGNLINSGFLRLQINYIPFFYKFQDFSMFVHKKFTFRERIL